MRMVYGSGYGNDDKIRPVYNRRVGCHQQPIGRLKVRSRHFARNILIFIEVVYFLVVQIISDGLDRFTERHGKR